MQNLGSKCIKGRQNGKTTPERCHSTLQPVIFVTFFPSRTHLVAKVAIKRFNLLADGR